MNSNAEPAKLEDLLALFEDVVQPEDIMYTKIISQASRYITKERLRLNMSQKEFADHIHAKQSLVSRWESGKYNFSLKKLAEICVALDMDLHIYMTPRHAQKNINAFSDFTTTTCNTKSMITIRSVASPKVSFKSSSAPQIHGSFSRYKEVMSC